MPTVLFIIGFLAFWAGLASARYGSLPRRLVLASGLMVIGVSMMAMVGLKWIEPQITPTDDMTKPPYNLIEVGAVVASDQKFEFVAGTSLIYVQLDGRTSNIMHPVIVARDYQPVVGQRLTCKTLTILKVEDRKRFLAYNEDHLTTCE